MEPLTALEREAFVEGFRAGMTTTWQIMCDVPNQTRDERESIFNAFAAAVDSWDLPIEMHVRAVDDSAATKQ
jgi:hypothetical protein